MVTGPDGVSTTACRFCGCASDPQGWRRGHSDPGSSSRRSPFARLLPESGADQHIELRAMAHRRCSWKNADHRDRGIPQNGGAKLSHRFRSGSRTATIAVGAGIVTVRSDGRMVQPAALRVMRHSELQIRPHSSSPPAHVERDRDMPASPGDAAPDQGLQNALIAVIPAAMSQTETGARAPLGVPVISERPLSAWTSRS